MRTGVQFTASLAGNDQKRWFSPNWPASSHVIWSMVPTNVRSGAAQLEWNVAVERASAESCTYWITVKNLTGSTVNFEGRYAVLN